MTSAFEAAKPSQPVITPYISDRIQFQTLTIVECRGMEITDFEPRVGSLNAFTNSDCRAHGGQKD